jgi:hypothetical protein
MVSRSEEKDVSKEIDGGKKGKSDRAADAEDEKKYQFRVKILDVDHPDLVHLSLQEVLDSFRLYITHFNGIEHIFDITRNDENVAEFEDIVKDTGIYKMLVSTRPVSAFQHNVVIIVSEAWIL